MRVCLINSGNDPGLGGNANAQCYPPLGIISLATVIKKAFADQVEVSLMDGQVDSVDDILFSLRKMRPDVVGVSMYCLSINNTIQIAREAKGLGAIVVIGNDHAAFHHRVLLQKIEEIDFICLGDVGEITIVSLIKCLLKQLEIGSVPDLAYRGEGQIINTSNRPRTASPGKYRPAEALDEIPIPDRSLLPAKYWEHYLKGFHAQRRKIFDSSKTRGVATINRARGCARSKDACRYCGIADLTPRGSSPEVFWKDVRAAAVQVGANVLYEAFDSATSWPSLLSAWATNKPEDLSDIRFFMYAQAAETSPKTVDIFKNLGVFCVNTGFDSGDDETLRILKGPRDSVATNRFAASLWADAGIEVYTSFVLVGLGNESRTRKSLDNTLDFARWLATKTSTISLDCALLYPDVSATVGSWIWRPDEAKTKAPALGWGFIDFEQLQNVSRKWRDEVFLDPLQLAADFAEICGVKVELLFEYGKEIQKISESSSLNFGLSQGGPID